MSQSDRLLDVLVQLKRVRMRPQNWRMLAPGEYLLLKQLQEDPSESCRVLGKKMGIKPAAVSGLLSRLEGRGYLRRNEHPTDRRRIDVLLTDSGRAALQEAEDSMKQLGNTLVSQLGEEGAEQFICLADQVLKGIHQFQTEKIR